MKQRLSETVSSYLADPAVSWSLGSFGAIAEFLRGEGEACAPAAARTLSLVTARGAIAIECNDAMESVSYTTPSRHAHRSHSAVAFCLPYERCAMARRSVVTELGADRSAVREEDHDAILFDMGLAQLQVDVCVRSRDPHVIARLRAATGTSIFDPAQTLMQEMPTLSPHRVFVSHAGRIEVYQGIPPSNGRSPDGPHTHVLPNLLRAQHTHAANIPIPDGLVPCLFAHLSAPREDFSGAP
ncbi:MAG: hypothetical protein JOZ16_03580 [Methylobacteriaceae bacterium]|nr:hypothetical protein [Methylobacteriaceae bacterium]